MPVQRLVTLITEDSLMKKKIFTGHPHSVVLHGEFASRRRAESAGQFTPAWGAEFCSRGGAPGTCHARD